MITLVKYVSSIAVSGWLHSDSAHLTHSALVTIRTFANKGNPDMTVPWELSDLDTLYLPMCEQRSVIFLCASTNKKYATLITYLSFKL